MHPLVVPLHSQVGGVGYIYQLIPNCNQHNRSIMKSRRNKRLSKKISNNANQRNKRLNKIKLRQD